MDRGAPGHLVISIWKRKRKKLVTNPRPRGARAVYKLCAVKGPGRFSPVRRSAAQIAICATFAGVLGLAGEARAEDPTSQPVEYQRRGGFVLGVALGPALGVARGYPNDARKIDRPEFFGDTGFSGGGAGSSWIGVGFTDWLTFGLAGHGGGLWSTDHRTVSAAFSFRVETFPAWALGGAWREFGASIEAGIGVTSTAPRAGGDDIVESGGASRFAFGLFYEGIRAWKVSMGPFAAVDVMWSSSAMRPLGWLGWRVALATKP
jgi:hypothetical protein